MLRLGRIARRLHTLVDSRRFEQDLEDELRFHLDREIDTNIARGMTPEEARRVAMRTFGGVEQTKVECREVNGVPLLEEVLNDIRYGLRTLRKSPEFTAVALATLMLGIGANTAVFSVVNGVLLHRLPFPHSDRIMTLWNTYPEVGGNRQEVSPPDFCDWRDQSRSFARMAAYEHFSWTVGGEPEPMRVNGARVSGDFFAVMGVLPLLGRPLLPTDDHEGMHHVVVLSHRLWVSRYGAEPSTVGRTLTLTGVKHTIVGVMPTGFGFPDDVDLWTPLAYEPPFPPSLRASVWLRTVARLRSGVTVEQAQQEMTAIARRLAARYPETNAGRSVVVVSLLDHTVGSVRPALIILLGAVGLVLLIACANVVNLILVRSIGRRREIAIRAALGASRRRIVRQLGTESAVLALVGGLGGLVLSRVSLAVLRRIGAESVPRMADVHIDLNVLLFAMLVSLAAGGLAGIMPAVVTAGHQLQESLQDAGPRTADSRRGKRWRHALVIAEVALAEVLLVGGSLVLQSFSHMRNVSPGFEPDGVLASRFDLHSRRYSSIGARESFYRETVARTVSVPGVQAVALATTIPTDDVQMTLDLVIEGRPRRTTPADSPWAGYNSVTPDYFRTMGIRLLSGRLFTDADDARAPAVAIVNTEMAQQYWPGESPLGRRFRVRPDEPADSAPAIEVVGVVDNVRQVALTAEARPELYLPYAQYPWREGFILVRAVAEGGGVAAAVRRQLHEVDPTIAVSEFRGMTDYISDSLAPPRFLTVLVSTFAVVALALAIVGVFGVASYSVSQRHRELAIRLALGAKRRDVFALAVGGGLRLVLAGVTLGLALAVPLSGSLRSLLFGIVPSDPATYAVAALVLSVVAAAACCLSCRRATEVDPAVALRSE